MFVKIRLHLFNCVRFWRIFQTLFPLSGVSLVRFLPTRARNEHKINTPLNRNLLATHDQLFKVILQDLIDIIEACACGGPDYKGLCQKHGE
jgi:hypothetical protein